MTEEVSEETAEKENNEINKSTREKKSEEFSEKENPMEEAEHFEVLLILFYKL